MTHSNDGNQKSTVQSANTALQGILQEYLTAGPVAAALPVTPTISKDSSIRDLTAFMDSMEVNMDQARGIIRTTRLPKLAHIGADPAQLSDVIIRDARLQTEEQGKLKPEDTVESWLIAAAARTRGALKLIEMADASPTKETAQKQSLEIFKGYEGKLTKASTPKDRKACIDAMDYELSFALKNNGLKVNGVDLSRCNQEKEVAKMLVLARDACNFESSNHPSIVTITRNLATDGASVNQVISSIPTTPCADADRAKHFGKDTMQAQPWYKALKGSSNPVNQIKAALTDTYQGKIADGKHITPTQLRWLPGTANTYVQDVSYLMDGKLNADKGFTSLRTAAPVHGRGEKTTDPILTKENTQHIDSLVGKGEYVGLNSNTGIIAKLIGQKSEQKITDSMQSAIQDQFISTPISVSRNKDRNLEKATNTILGTESQKGMTKLQKIKKLFCKSGKDRTQAVLEESGLRDAHTVVAGERGVLSEKDKLTISLSVKQAAHGEAMSGGNGSSRGSFGTKIGNVFGSNWKARLAGMNLKRGEILNIKDFGENTIQKITAIDIKKPKDPVLPMLKAEMQTEKIKNSLKGYIVGKVQSMMPSSSRRGPTEYKNLR